MYFTGTYSVRKCKKNLTLGVCPLTFPARARDPWTLPEEGGKEDGSVSWDNSHSNQKSRNCSDTM